MSELDSALTRRCEGCGRELPSTFAVPFTARWRPHAGKRRAGRWLKSGYSPHHGEFVPASCEYCLDVPLTDEEKSMRRGFWAGWYYVQEGDAMCRNEMGQVLTHLAQ